MKTPSRLALLLCVVLFVLWLNTRMMLPARQPTTDWQPTAAAAAAVGPAAAAAADQAEAQLTGELEPALRRALPSGPGGVLLLTFGDKGYRGAILNFVSTCEASGAPHVLGAVDRETFSWFSARGTAVYLTPLAKEAYKFDGSNAHASDAWLKFARMRTGEIARIVNLGYAVLHTDTDVAWLRDPTPYLSCDAQLDAQLSLRGASCGWLKRADVAVSSDNMSPGEDMRIGGAYAAGGTLNTGILFIRPTAAGRAFATRWHKTVTRPPPGPKYAGPGCCTSDQQVFGRMVRR